jgi:hypothetical protein
LKLVNAVTVLQPMMFVLVSTIARAVTLDMLSLILADAKG